MKPFINCSQCRHSEYVSVSARGVADRFPDDRICLLCHKRRHLISKNSQFPPACPHAERSLRGEIGAATGDKHVLTAS